jgi:hypothetical protein
MHIIDVNNFLKRVAEGPEGDVIVNLWDAVAAVLFKISPEILRQFLITETTVFRLQIDPRSDPKSHIIIWKHGNRMVVSRVGNELHIEQPNKPLGWPFCNCRRLPLCLARHSRVQREQRWVAVRPRDFLWHFSSIRGGGLGRPHRGLRPFFKENRERGEEEESGRCLWTVAPRQSSVGQVTCELDLSSKAMGRGAYPW